MNVGLNLARISRGTRIFQRLWFNLPASGTKMTLDRTYFFIIFGIVLRTQKSEQHYRLRNLLKDITDLPVCVKSENCVFFFL